ncbi:ATP-binding protein [Metabacillus sp. HB246100]|uniref:ATP-binding protein n=1 Tax=Bacillus weihaiensis TaxID=1547283 RepID=UPI0023561584|nr:ATP-binding protein [Bacillus weihaiensis]
MAIFIKDLLLHYAIVLFLPFIYHFVSIQRIRVSPKLVFYTSILLVLFVTIVFPITFTPLYSFDLKFIPFFISFFYGGPIFSFIIVLLIPCLDYFIGEEVFIVNFINYAIIYLVFYLLRYTYKNGSIVRKIMFALFIQLLITFSRIVMLIKDNNTNEYSHFLLFSLFSFLALALVIYIIEMTNFHSRTLKELEKAEKLHTISQLSASVAHEIRNPMTTINGFMQLIRGETNLTKDQNLFIDISIKELERTQSIISNFLSLSKPSPSDKAIQVVSLTELINETVEFMNPFALIRGIKLNSSVQEGVKVKAHDEDLRQVLINIIKNGIESIKENGQVVVILLENEKEIVIEIIDNGIGMNKKQMKKLGQPYYTTKNAGTGLGLMISYNMIKLIDGKIDVQSEVGKGTTFIIKLPKIE